MKERQSGQHQKPKKPPSKGETEHEYTLSIPVNPFFAVGGAYGSRVRRIRKSPCLPHCHCHGPG